MRPRFLLVLLAVLAFLGVLLLRFPLKWAVGLLPPNLTCGQPSGSVWVGRCGALTVAATPAPLPLGAVSWQISMGALLRTHVVGTVHLEGPQLLGSAQIDASLARDVLLREVDITAPIDRRLLGMVPANWTGQLQARIARLSIRGGRLEALQGSVEAHEVVAQGPKPDEFGSYSLVFDEAAGGAAGVHRGRLKDLGGPLDVNGTLDLKDTFAWEFDAYVAARPSATPQLSRLIEYLGPPDGQGRRRFSAAGDF